MQVQSTYALALLFKPRSSNIYIVYGQNQLPKPKKNTWNDIESHVKPKWSPQELWVLIVTIIWSKLKKSSSYLSVFINNTLSAKSCPLLKTQQIAQKVSCYYINETRWNYLQHKCSNINQLLKGISWNDMTWSQKHPAIEEVMLSDMEGQSWFISSHLTYTSKNAPSNVNSFDVRLCLVLV